MARGMYGPEDAKRVLEEGAGRLDPEGYRTPWRRDAARVLHSACFRRLQGKTQLFPTFESDFFRNRLTHSLEVGQIAKSIAIRLNSTEDFLKQVGYEISPDICEVAAWCHDLGHPPFGHTGEHALDGSMKEQGGFEGNAQTLRILCCLEKRVTDADDCVTPTKGDRDLRRGLNLTFRTLASVLKYDREIPATRAPEHALVKGFYSTEAELVQKIKDAVTGRAGFRGAFRTIECSIMDMADDIAYSTYDLEDAFKAGFLSPMDLVSARPEIVEAVSEQINERHPSWEFTPQLVQDYLFEIFQDLFTTNLSRVKPPRALTAEELAAVTSSVYQTSRELVGNGYLRTRFTSYLVGQFVRAIEFEPRADIPALSQAHLGEQAMAQVEVLKN